MPLQLLPSPQRQVKGTCGCSRTACLGFKTLGGAQLQMKEAP